MEDLKSAAALHEQRGLMEQIAEMSAECVMRAWGALPDGRITKPMPAKIATALVKAARSAEAVEKKRHMESSNERGPRYNFAGADALMAEAREALAGAGLAVVLTGWRVTFEPRHDWNEKAERFEWTERTVHSTFLLVHEEAGDSHELGTFAMPSIPGAGRPIDKADASALTYATGYVMRGLLNLPRVEPGQQVDERDDTTVAKPGPKRGPSAEDKRAEAVAKVKASLAAVPGKDFGSLQAWVAAKYGKALDILGEETVAPLVADAATRLGDDIADVAGWIKAAAK